MSGFGLRHFRLWARIVGMNTQSEHILRSALALPESERAEIAASLIHSLDTETDKLTFQSAVSRVISLFLAREWLASPWITPNELVAELQRHWAEQLLGPRMTSNH